MSANLWIENSRKTYAAFLSLYPHEHRSEYGASMRQVFADQCRDVYQKKGTLGLILLWLRTLPDLGYSALLEHIASPRASWGLMEPVPNEPLPWKGIFLILLPGLVYLISQIAQLTGQPWYMMVYYRAAFFLIIPVLVVWALTRRFPLWGLIPVGLLYRLTQEIGYQFIALHPGVFSKNQFLNTILQLAMQVDKQPYFLAIPFTLAIICLAWRYTRQQKSSRSFWLWLGIFILVTAAGMVQSYVAFTNYIDGELANRIESMLQAWFLNSGQWILYDTAAFLLLIFIGTLFTRRHGFFAILIPIGYIIPTRLIGLQNFNEFPNPTLALLIFSAAILIYRTVLTLVAPIWMSRTPSQSGKRKIVLVSILIALTIHALTQFYPAMLYSYSPEMHISPVWALSTALEELKLISAFVLAIVMYQNAQPQPDTIQPAPAQNTKLSASQA